eukprot:32849-Prorocentrum_minimum.AAC.1
MFKRPSGPPPDLLRTPSGPPPDPLQPPPEKQCLRNVRNGHRAERLAPRGIEVGSSRPLYAPLMP